MKNETEQQRARRLWVEALRSGDYKQTKHRLADENGFCCLGVLCEVAKREGVIKDYRGNRYDLDAARGVQEWVGLRDDYGTLKGERASLVNLNDDLGYTFDQIADVIESEPEGLFVS